MGVSTYNQIRGQGRVRIRKELWYKGPIQRIEIAEALSMSLPAVTTTINRMMDNGEVCEQKMGILQNGKLGRRTSVVDIVADSRYFIGIEMRRDSRHVCLCDYRGNVMDSLDENISYPDYEQNFAAVCRITLTLLDRICVPREKLYGMCISLPGIVDYENGILVAHNLYGWFDKPIVRDLVQALKWESHAIAENDGCTRAFGARMLHRKSFDEVNTFAYLMIARGISCPFLTNETADVSHPLGIGELGHMIIRADEAIDAGQIVGNLSSLAGERAILDQCQEAMRQGNAPFLFAICGGDVRPTIQQVLQAQQAGEKTVQTILERAFRFLAVALANVYNFVQPDLIFVDSCLFSNEKNRAVLTETMHRYLMVTHKNRPTIKFVEPELEYGARCAALCAIRTDLELNETGANQQT